MSDFDLTCLAAADAAAAYDRHGLAAWSDVDLVAAVGRVLARPKEQPADSFVLHAPLELLARAGLLARLQPAGRDRARRRLVWLAASYNEAGDALPDPPRPATGADDLEAVATQLVAALEAGDLDDIDRWSAELGRRATALELRRLLAPAVVPSLAAAAHGSILLSLYPRMAAAAGVPGGVVRGLARDLGRHPDWRLRWFDDPGEPGVPAPLAEVLLDVPMLGPAGSNFIQPIMSQAEDSGIAPKLLGGVIDDPHLDVGRVRAELSRIAAWSMLQEPSHHAYGWSHCLTMPQAVMNLAGDVVDARAAVAVAATHVVGFRAALGGRDLEPSFRPVRPDVASLAEALDAGPGHAASYAWFAASEDPSLDAQLAEAAAAHHDAHFAKYTLACLEAAAADPSERPLYLAAAGFLAGYWSFKGDDGLFSSPTAEVL